MILSNQQLHEINELRAAGWKFREIARDLELDEGNMRREYMAWLKEKAKTSSFEKP